MRWRKLMVGGILTLCLTLVYAGASQAADLDNTTCTVYSTTDDAKNFHSLRNKIENFNRPFQRLCTELINFQRDNSDPMVIKLGRKLYVHGENDTDCANSDNDLCLDGITFTLDGTTHSPGVKIDTTAVNEGDDRCAIEISGVDQVYKGLVIVSNQTKLYGEITVNEDGEEELPHAVICLKGASRINLDDVELDSQGQGICGDGIVQEELGEECDDGEDNGPDKPCTDACTVGSVDSDGDGVPDDIDNCDNDPNPGQEDCDADGEGNACDNDWDNDGVADGVDNCPPDHNVCDFAELAGSANPDQLNTDEATEDENGEPHMGDLCDPDNDGDGILDDGDGSGVEGDNPCVGGATENCDDNCPILINPEQTDADQDGMGAACDSDEVPPDEDVDGDGIPDAGDNCPGLANPGQEDLDSDGFGDACDTDLDGDGISNADEDGEACLDKLNPDSDGDGVEDGDDPCPCDGEDKCFGPDPSDEDGDGIVNAVDNCPSHKNPSQEDGDGDGVGDACDLDNPTADSDNDGVLNQDDNCPANANPAQENQDGDSKGDICDEDPEVAAPDTNESDSGSTASGCALGSSQPNALWFGWLLALPLLGIWVRRRAKVRVSK